jgi:intracellular sulfur oxidation DsrE/DsrF family protein
MRLLILLFACWCSTSIAVAARPAGQGEVYIAGDPFTVDEAISQALRENSYEDHRQFWVVAVGPEIPKLSRQKATSATRESLRELFRRGGVVMACEFDLPQLGLAKADLLPGVKPVRGFRQHHSDPASRSLVSPGVGRISLPELGLHKRRILQACAERH